MNKTKNIKEIIKLEYKMFSDVSNIGGRASCQDNFDTFQIMRESQYMAWSDELVASYLADVQSAVLLGRNLPAEKYAWMMERTDPKEFERVKRALPELSDEKKFLIKSIMKIQYGMTEELYEQYPKTMAFSRPLNDDPLRPGVTSAITYLYGELCTYSIKTLHAYLNNLKDYQKKNTNLPIEIMSYTSKAYGYSGLEGRENAL